MKTTLIIMAAGIGSRFGTGIKQLAKMSDNGEIIMDYSIYDAKEAGFDKVVFVIRKDIEEEFKAGDRKPHRLSDRSGICIPGTDRSAGWLHRAGRT